MNWNFYCASTLKSNSYDVQVLNLPRVGLDDFWELLLGATGPFVIRRAMGILTSARCCELLELRQGGQAGTLQEYHELCQILPQVFDILSLVNIQNPGPENSRMLYKEDLLV